MKCETPAFAAVSSREPAPIQKPIATERTCASRSEMTRSPESSSVRTYRCTHGSYSGGPARLVACRKPSSRRSCGPRSTASRPTLPRRCRPLLTERGPNGRTEVSGIRLGERATGLADEHRRRASDLIVGRLLVVGLRLREDRARVPERECLLRLEAGDARVGRAHYVVG